MLGTLPLFESFLLSSLLDSSPFSDSSLLLSSSTLSCSSFSSGLISGSLGFSGAPGVSSSGLSGITSLSSGFSGISGISGVSGFSESPGLSGVSEPPGFSTPYTNSLSPVSFPLFISIFFSVLSTPLNILFPVILFNDTLYISPSFPLTSTVPIFIVPFLDTKFSFDVTYIFIIFFSLSYL